MILQLLKKLRTIRPTRTTLDRVRDSVTFGLATLVSLGCYDALQAQQFRSPPVRNDGVFQLPEELLRQKFEHAQALRAQMERVEQEQRSPDGFAEGAFRAQQAYLAELAYDEYATYQRMQREKAEKEGLDQRSLPSNANSSQALPAYRTATRNSSYTNSNYSNPTYPARPSQESIGYQGRTQGSVQRGNFSPVQQPSTFTPPVHIVPQNSERVAPVTMKLSDMNRRVDAGVTPASMQPPVQRTAQRLPEPASQPRVQPQYRSVPQNMQQPPMQRPAVRGQQQTEQPQMRSNQPIGVPVTMMPVENRQGSTTRNVPVSRNAKPYIIESNPVGLQDKIASFLSKPEYRRTSAPNSMRQSAPRTVPSYRPPSQQPSQSQPLPRRDILSRAVRSGVSETRENTMKKTYPVRQADLSAMRQGRIHQATMIEPVQDPFGDLPAAPALSNAGPRLNAPIQGPETGSPQLSMPRLAQNQQFQMPKASTGQVNARIAAARTVQEQMRQVSILQTQEQDQGSQQSGGDFGGGNSFQRPTQPVENLPVPESSQETTPATDPFGGDSAIRDIEEEARREFDRIQQSGPGAGDQDQGFGNSSQADDLREQRAQELRDKMQQLEQELEQESGETDPVLDQEYGESRPGNRLIQKSCDQFRDELLGSSIRDIALDISPPASANRDQFGAISRSWTDRSGNVIANGTMVDLRRGYVILDTVDGQSKIPYAKLSDADLAAISQYWQLPDVCTVGGTIVPTRNWIPQTYTWKASGLCHKPLYFENIQLERYGHTHGPILQPFYSTGHFFVSMFRLPSATAINPPTECQYALGFYRPGNCAPWLKEPIPFSLDGIRRQSLITTALSFIP